MIIDSLANIGRYASLGPGFAAAVRFLQTADLDALPMGRTDICGSDVYAMLADNQLDEHPMAYEAHALYADIQLILRGEERFGWGPTGDYGPLNGDFQTVDHVRGFAFTLEAGQFAIFLPTEPHAPGNPAAAPGVCRKLAIKVLHKG